MRPSISDAADFMHDSINTVLRPRIFWASLLGLCFLVSLVITLFMPAKNIYTLWFPDARDVAHISRAELRAIPAAASPEAQAQALVEELMLGPLDAASRPVCRPDVKVHSALLSSRSGKKMLYIDISSDILFGKTDKTGISAEPVLEPEQALNYIEKAVRWNFPFYGLILTVDGKEASWPQKNNKKEVNNG